jgi:Uma2 family endonuclease
VLFVSPRARPGHQSVAAQLTTRLVNRTERTGEGRVIPDADLIVDERNTYISPDIMYFAGDRYAQIDPNEMIRIIPDLVVEVLSPSTSRYDLVTKRHVYEQLDVPHYWMVDTRTRAIRECVLGADGRYVERVVTESDPFEPALFPGLSIDLRRVFE